MRDFSAARPWYEKLLGVEPSFLPHDTEAVWELGERHALFIVEDERRAGYTEHTLLAEDLDALVSEVEARGLKVSEWESYSNGVRKAIYRDADGNGVGFAGVPGG